MGNNKFAIIKREITFPESEKGIYYVSEGHGRVGWSDRSLSVNIEDAFKYDCINDTFIRDLSDKSENTLFFQKDFGLDGIGCITKKYIETKIYV